MPTQTIKIVTNEEGAYQRVDHFNPPGWFDLTVQLKARLSSPAATTITGTIDIDAEDGHPQNQSQEFTLETDQEESLGRWHIDGGSNTLSVTGQTHPVRANTEIEIILDVDLIGF